MLVQHSPGVMPNLIAIADPEPGGAGRRHYVFSIRTPEEMCGIFSLGFRHLLVFLHVPNFHLPSQVPEPSKDEDMTLGAVESCVAGARAKVEH